MTNEVTRDPIAVLLRLVDDFEWAVKTQRSGDADKLRKAIRTHVESMLPLPVAGIPATGEAMPDTEQPCYCGPGISLQSVSGGAHETGLFGTVWLRIDDELVEYVRKSVGPAVVTGTLHIPRTTECRPGDKLYSYAPPSPEARAAGCRPVGEGAVPVLDTSKLTPWPPGMGLEPEKVALEKPMGRVQPTQEPGHD